MRKTLLLCLMGMVGLASAHAQSSTAKPTYRTFAFEDGAIFQNMSDNGKWGAFCCQKSDVIAMTGARVVNLQTGEATLLSDGLNTDTISSIAAYDVTNDGNIVVGEINSRPAYYNVATKTWNYLKYKGITGSAKSVTPDGRYAVGVIYPNSNEYQEKAQLWDLATGDTIATPNLPTKDMDHADMGQNRFINISADAKKVLGCMSFSYLPVGDDLGGVFYYVYDLTNHTYKPIGFTESDTERWTAKWPNLHFIYDATMGHDGHYVTGTCYLTSSSDENFYPFKYNTETDEIEVYDDANSQDYGGYVVDANGEVYAAGPEGNIYRDFGIRSGNYWVNFTQTLKQHYNFDLSASLGLDNSGTPIGLSDDGYTFGVYAGDQDSYVITLPDNFTELAKSTNLLSSYTVSPAEGSTFAKVSKVKLTFTRTVQTLTKAENIKLYDVMNDSYTSAFGFAVDDSDPYSVNITFNAAKLPDPAGIYLLQIPAKAISIKGDATRYNEAIELSYNGREDVPMKLTESSPKEGASLGKINATTSPVILTFDADIKVASTTSNAALYQKGFTTPVASLLLAANGKKLYVYSATEQKLVKDVDYQIVLPAGSITDINGNKSSANQEITLNLRGAYEREISYDSNVLYSENFDNGLGNVLLYDGDTNTPDSESKSYDFDAAGNAYAWVPVRSDNNSTGYSAASTSMYSPTGTSDDWLVVPQINIPDKFCSLTFLSQSFRKAAKDSLKVVVWESDNIYSVLTDDVVDLMKQEGKVVYNKLQSPGKSEAKLDGDWTHNTIDLADFAGKNVYIGFVNQNNNQSLVFIDSVQVMHNLPFYAAFNYEETVVNKKEADISGSVSIADSTKTFSTFRVTLKDSKGNVVDEVSESGLSLKKGDTHAFKFSKALPLTVGEVNRFSVEFQLDDQTNSVSKTIRDLNFEPTKRVVLEEFTGMGCTNCPLGILGIENLQKTYGDLFIPMALHCYTGDQLGTGVSSYAAFLNLTAAPSGIVQRGDITYPITQDKVTAAYSFMPSETTTYTTTWQNEVQKQLEQPAQCELTATATLAKDGSKFTVPCTVKYALNASDVNLKLFAVVLCDGLVGYQSNGFSAISDPVIGEWGQGGRYGMTSVNPYTFNHVVRGYYGETFTGTPDLFPTTIEAGKEYTTTLTVPMPSTVDIRTEANNTEVVLMLFDGNTDQLLNAYKVKPSNQIDAVENVTDNSTAAVVVTTNSGKITVSSAAAATVQVFSIDGSRLAQAQGEGILTLAPQHKGVAIVRVNTANGTVVKKVIL